MAETSAGFLKASAFVKARGHSPASPTEDDKNEFLGMAAREYARVTSDAIRRQDRNHMVLGCRFAGYPGDSAIQAVGEYFDVISFPSYSPMRLPTGWRRLPS